MNNWAGRGTVLGSNIVTKCRNLGWRRVAIAASLPVWVCSWTAAALAQANSTGSGTQRGSQLIFNGKPITASWVYQWQAMGTSAPVARFSVSDAAIAKATGVQFLNTGLATQQPIQWFAASGATASLPARVENGYRLLDITDWARQLGWRMEMNTGKLQIVTPSARVLAVRQGKQSWGDRLVIELDRPATWQTDAQAQEFWLTLDAQIEPAVIQALKTTPGIYLQSLKAEAVGTQTRLRLGIPIGSNPPRIWSLATPNRIIVDIRPDSLVEQNILWSPGLRWRQQIIPLGTSPIPVVWLEVNPRQPGLALKPILPNPSSMMGTAPLLQTAQKAQAAAAINGGFFNRNRQLPLGAVRIDRRWVSGPILNRGAIAWDPSGNFRFNRLTLQETLISSTGQRFPMTHLNSGYVQAGIARYTPDWGTTYTPLSDGEIALTVQANRITHQQSLDKADTGALPIPANGYLLILRSNRAAATALPVETGLTIDSLTVPTDFNLFPDIVGAGPLLVQNGQIVLNAKVEGFSDAFANEAAARSAIARTTDGTVLIVAAHAHLDGSGLTLLEMAQLMQRLGAVDALNLDGGSSTTLYLGGQLLDRAPRTAARVHDAIGIFVGSTNNR